jgi:hypothetical protein
MELLENFNILREHVFKKCRLKITDTVLDKESTEYHACSFKINNQNAQYRHAKITPTKIGQFVTIWKRSGSGPIQPFDDSDNVEFFIATVKTKTHFGHFVFPKKVLVKRGVFSVKGKGGKRALRIYPPWDKTESPQAKKTQEWQLKFFADIPKDKSINIQKFKTLYLV